jgi:zinc D-Ala-D-Ala dipeptidase
VAFFDRFLIAYSKNSVTVAGTVPDLHRLPFSFRVGRNQRHAKGTAHFADFDASKFEEQNGRRNFEPNIEIMKIVLLLLCTLLLRCSSLPTQDLRVGAPSIGSRVPIEAATHPGFTDVKELDTSIALDIRYATTDNFTKAKIYDCPACLLRPEAAEAVVRVHKALQKKGLGLKMFDCYRPRPYQQRLWDKVPNPDYVTPPAKGSMHSRGAAVDLTVVDKAGKELDMGTPYDFFGPEAHTDNKNLPKEVLKNRKILRKAMEAEGFKGIRTEWWHFSYQKKKYELDSYLWPCK